MWWPILAFFMPIYVAWTEGSTYAFGASVKERFFAILEYELINRRSFRTHKEARLAIFSYIEGWYNPHRRHSSIAYHAPIAYEKLHLSQA